MIQDNKIRTNNKIFYTLKEISESNFYDLSVRDIITYACDGKLPLAAYINMNNVTLKPYLLYHEHDFVPKTGLYYIDKTNLYEISVTNTVDSILINYVTQKHFTYYEHNYYLDNESIDTSVCEDDYDDYFELDVPDKLPMDDFDFEDPYIVKLDDIGILNDDFYLLDQIISTRRNALTSTMKSASLNSERKTLLLIIKALIHILLGRYPGLDKHPALLGTASDLKNKMLELEERGLRQRNLETLFSAVNGGKICSISENTLLITIAVLIEIVMGKTEITDMKGKLHPYIKGQTYKENYQDLVSKMAMLEQGLEEIDLPSIFTKAEAAKKTS